MAQPPAKGGATGVFISHASLWELAIKVSLGRVQVELMELERQMLQDGSTVVGV